MVVTSDQVVSEFFSYAINNLLHIREVYPPASFSRVSKYGLTMPLITEKSVSEYIKSVLQQMKVWLVRRCLQRVVVVIASVTTGKVLERWVFDVKKLDKVQDDPMLGGLNEDAEKKVIGEVQAVMRQMMASASFLPIIEEECSFDVLMYIDRAEDAPSSWENCQAKVITNRDQVQLRSFSTPECSIIASVSYGKAIS